MISGFQSRYAFIHPPAAPALQTPLCTTPDTSPCIHQAGDGNNPPYPVSRQQTPTLRAVLLTARTSNIYVNSLGTREGWYLTAESAQDICIQRLYEHTRQHYSANIVRELQDNEAKFKLCMVYRYTVLGFTVAFSVFMTGCVSLQSIHRFDLSWHQWKPERAAISLVQLINILILSSLLQRH